MGKNTRRATPGAPITIEDAPTNLARRLRKYDEMSKGLRFDTGAFHRPGSMKK